MKKLFAAVAFIALGVFSSGAWAPYNPGGGGAAAVTSVTLLNTGLNVRDITNGVNTLGIVPNETLTAPRTLNLIVNDASRTINLSGNVTIGGAFTTVGAFATAGAFTTVGGAVTLPAQVAPASDDQILIADSATGATWRSITNCTDTGGNHLNYTAATNTLSCGTTASATSLNGITAATGAVTIANGNNTGIVWNWANTTDSTVAHTLGETSAATAGTSTSGVPNQVLLKLTTLAASTQSPLSVYSRGSHVFSVSPSAAQILATNGSSAAPAYSWAGSTNTGIASTGANMIFYVSGASTAQITATTGIQSNIAGTVSVPSVGVGDSTTGFSNISGTDFVQVLTGTEQYRQTSGLIRFSKSSNDTVSYAINVRKSRGIIAAPTVITTGDTLRTDSAFGYVGATNTYLEASRISSVSTGTITDATTGLGGYLAFATALQGTSTAPAESLRLDSNGHLNFLAGTQGAAPTVTAACGTSPTVTGNDSAFVLNVGTGGTATTCTVTFNKTFTNAPHCFAQDQTSQAITTTAVPSTSTVVLTASAAWTASSKIDVLCVGHL